MQNQLIRFVLVALSLPAPLFARSVEARFTTDKTMYLAGEPVFVSLRVTNNGGEPVWLEFNPQDMPFLCYDFAIEVSWAEPPEPWGCGMAGSCGRGATSVEPGTSITKRRLLNREFRFQGIGSYSIHAHTTIVVRKWNLFDAPIVEQFEASDTISIEVQRGGENQLRAAFQPFVAEIDSPDPMAQSDGTSAITELAPAFLEDVLIRLTKTKYAGAAVTALRKVNTPKAWDVLAQLATANDDHSVRIAAIENLGRTSSTTYLPVLYQLMQSNDQEIRAIAAEAAGELGKSASVQQIATLLANADSGARQAGANGLGRTHTRAAVPLLIALLLESDANVRQAAVSSLFLLTHHAALGEGGWSDATTSEGGAIVHERWIKWWDLHSGTSKMHGMADCAPPEGID